MVVFGIDPHKHTHTIVAVDQAGRKLGHITIPATREGHLKGFRWAQGLQAVQGVTAARWGVEDGRHVNKRLVDDLVAAGAEVVAVPPRLMAGARTAGRERGKSDPIDALAVARVTLREPDLPTARLDPDSLTVRNLVDYREQLVTERTRWINRLRWRLVRFAPDLEQTTNLTSQRALRRLRTDLEELPASLDRQLALETVERILTDTIRIAELERQIREAVTPLAPSLLAIPGVAALTAGKLIGEIAGITRFSSGAQLASLSGTACIPVWTGGRERFRLNRGGNRQLNAAVHRIAISQIRWHQPAQTLYERRLTQHGDTKKGALRVLKRHLIDVIYRAMLTDHHARHVIPAHQPAAAA
jgi:transposase